MNAARLALDALEQFGEYTSVYFEGEASTNFERTQAAARLATILKESGVASGDRVVVMMPTCPQTQDAFQAIWRLGAVIVPITPQLIAREVCYIVENSGARLVLTSSALAETVTEAVQGNDNIDGILVFGACPIDGTKDIEGLVDRATPLETVCEREEDDLAILLYTSGTTGHPKGVRLSHHNMVSNARALVAIRAAQPGRRTLLALPLSHVYGVMVMLLGAMMGVVSVLLRRFDAEKMLEAIEEHRIQETYLVPTMLVALMNCPERETYDVSSLEIARCGAAPLANELRIEFQRLFSCQVYEGYGLSEVTCAAASYPQGEKVVPGSVGRALPGVELRVVDEEGNSLAPGATGEICIRGPNIMQGYWKNEEATKAAIIDGWLRTGDLGHIDEQGYVFISGRKKEVIIKGGENISPREVEEAFYLHPAAAEVAVFGVPHDRYGEDLVAAIVLKDGEEATYEELCSRAGGQITKFKLPSRILFKTQLPKNSNGKILRRKLREEFIEAQGMS